MHPELLGCFAAGQIAAALATSYRLARLSNRELDGGPTADLFTRSMLR